MRIRFGLVALAGLAAMIAAGRLPAQTPPPAQTPAQAPVFALKRCTNLPEPVQMHGCAVVGNRIYVFGGGATRTGWTNDVYSAPIEMDGSLGQWRREQPMPERRFYTGTSIEVVNSRIYVVGGNIAPLATSVEKDQVFATDALWTSVLSDGSLAPWQHSAPFPGAARANLAVAASDRNLFVLGGLSSGAVLDDVLCAEFGPDGNPTGWRQVAKLPTPLWFHGAAVLDDRMYVWGGLAQRDNTPVNGKVYSAAVLPDGALSAWEVEPNPMPVPLYSSSFCGFNDHLIAISGRTDKGGYSNFIEFTPPQGQAPGPVDDPQ